MDARFFPGALPGGFDIASETNISLTHVLKYYLALRGDNARLPSSIGRSEAEELYFNADNDEDLSPVTKTFIENQKEIVGEGRSPDKIPDLNMPCGLDTKYPVKEANLEKKDDQQRRELIGTFLIEQEAYFGRFNETYEKIVAVERAIEDALVEIRTAQGTSISNAARKALLGLKDQLREVKGAVINFKTKIESVQLVQEAELDKINFGIGEITEITVEISHKIQEAANLEDETGEERAAKFKRNREDQDRKQQELSEEYEDDDDEGDDEIDSEVAVAASTPGHLGQSKKQLALRSKPKKKKIKKSGGKKTSKKKPAKKGSSGSSSSSEPQHRSIDPN